MVERNILPNMPSALADDRDHFTFIVELGRDRRADDRGAGTDQAGAETRKDCGIGWHNEAALDRMVDIIKSHADDLSGGRQRREQRDLIEINGYPVLKRSSCGDEPVAAFSDENIERARIARVPVHQAMKLSIRTGYCQPFPLSAPERGKSHRHSLSMFFGGNPRSLR
jgi:hypothetical protein